MRARFEGSWTFASLNSWLEGYNEEDAASTTTSGGFYEL
jgi:hypothetical protein